MKHVVLWLPVLLCLLKADDNAASEALYPWGIASSFRSASIPYTSAIKEDFLDGYVLLLYLQTHYLFLDGTEGGVNLYRDGQWQFSLYGAMHFVDMPRHDPAYFSEDTADLGLMARYRYEQSETDLLLLSDPAWRTHLKWRVSRPYTVASLTLKPTLSLEYKSSDYNSYYYGQNREAIAGDVGVQAGVAARWHLTDTLALLADAKATYLGYRVAQSDSVDTAFQSELYLGAGFFQAPKSRPHSSYDPKGYLRLAFGEATPSSFSEIATAEGTRARHDLHMLSLFYGLPLSKVLFDLPIHTYFGLGFVHHFAHPDLQPPSQEYVGSIKFYYRPQPWWLRFGLGTGLSYITEPTYIERYLNTKDGYDHSSNLLQHVDISFDIELKHIIGEAAEDLWFGYGLHHRSGVFETAHQYGQIKGGSNYNTLYLQWHFGEEG